MLRQTDRYFKFDWLTIALYFVLVAFGWLNIVSASHNTEVLNFFDISQPHGKQLLFIGLSLILIVAILAFETKFYERYASLIYVASMLSLMGLFIFGKNVNGATSWYGIGGFTIQPSEFAKCATALALAKYLSAFDTSIKRFSNLAKAALIISIPAVLILLQNDAGSTIVYAAFFFVLYREGLPQIYLHLIIIIVLASVISLKLNAIIATILLTVILLAYYFIARRKPKKRYLALVILFSGCVAFGSQFFYQSILKPHQQDRISLWLRLENDPEKLAIMRQSILYNLRESEKAIRSGGLLGKGFLQGTRTTGKFVPEQHTDYIFSTVGEEWGFLGSIAVVIVFSIFIARIGILANRQKNAFSRVYGYGVASIFLIHFMINVGMVMGLIPTIGIPLPFFSYGGSALWGFTILLFIFIKLDSNKINEW